jgi:hypothetical protein
LGNYWAGGALKAVGAEQKPYKTQTKGLFYQVILEDSLPG